MIKAQFIEKLKNNADIVEIISKYIEVKKAGRSFVALCPFHDDKNPSLHINEEKAYYHCFSCKASGDVITFIREYEKLSYVEAIEKLADFMNMEVEYSDNKTFKNPNKILLPTLDLFYKEQLLSNPSALNYLNSRKITQDLREKFGLGFAPASQLTLQVLKNEGFTLNEALELGAIKKGEQGYYASFSNRITFPIHNHYGTLIAFGGRTISNHPAKYINSSQNILFNKSKVLYNFHRAREEIYAKKEIIICEGYLDTIMLTKAGYKNTVAVLGTALTEEHLPLLKREDLKVILSFDGDEAGRTAALKSSKLLSLNKIQAYVVLFPSNSDPADLVAENREEELKRIFANKIDAIEFFIRESLRKYDLTSAISKAKALEEISTFTQELDFLVAQNYQNLVSELLQLPLTSFKLFKDESFELKKKLPKAEGKKDILELRILKTLKEDELWAKNVSPLLSKINFKIHGDIYEKISKRDYNNSLIISLILDERIEILEGNSRYKALIMLKIRQVEGEIKIANLSEDEIFSKQKELRELKKKLKEL